MPSIHVSEDVFERYVEREGGYKAAKEAVKQAIEDGIGSSERE